MTQLKCPHCGSTDLSASTAVRIHGDGGWSLKYEIEGQGFWARLTGGAVEPKHGRFCWDCGYVLVFVDTAKALALRSKMKPVAP